MITPREGQSNFSIFAARQLLPRLRPHRTALSVAAVSLVVSAAIGLAFPLIVRHLMLAVFAAQAVFNFVQVFLLSATAERVVAGLRTELFAHLLTLSPGMLRHSVRMPKSGPPTIRSSLRSPPTCPPTASFSPRQLPEIAARLP